MNPAQSYRAIAGHYAVSRSALQRHKADHLPAGLVQAQGAASVARADDLLADLGMLRQDARRIARKAEAADSYAAATAAIREQGRIIELLLRVAGELNERPTVNVLVLPEWVAIRAAMFEALQPYPEAGRAVAARLLMLEGQHD